MLFHTWIFALFMLAVYPIYLLTRKSIPLMNAWLLLWSYVFYGWWNPAYLLLIVASTVFDWYMGLLIGKGKHKKLWITFSILMNMGFLGFYKYWGFLAENLAGLGVALPVADVLLPVGISFFTFQSMSYTIDVYRGEIPVERSLVRFAAFVSLFPQLVAGPIERASNLLPQLQKAPTITREDLADGLSHFLVGLFKKIALADYLAPYVDAIYNDPGKASGSALAAATVAFAWQIYFDFSGYTDMARGVGRMMGFRFMLNFNNPYVATGLGDFWNRWHISLSTWFKDYVYYPLGGNRGGKLLTYRNMVVTMLLSGIWHGAAWTFVIWGALHAIGRVITRELELTPFYRDRVPRALKQIGVFVFVCVCWIFFRAKSVPEAWLVLSGLFTRPWGVSGMPVMMMLMIAVVWAWQILAEGERTRPIVQAAPVQFAIASVMAAYLMIVAQSGNQAFIYFQF
jgi:alginate O-acetyltransferase complex protein AlgI